MTALSARERWRRRGAVLPASGAPADADTLRWLDELLRDAGNSPRLTRWEQSFTADFRAARAAQGARLPISAGQLRVLRAIEEKIHAAG